VIERKFLIQNEADLPFLVRWFHSGYAYIAIRAAWYGQRELVAVGHKLTDFGSDEGLGREAVIYGKDAAGNVVPVFTTDPKGGK
jgi:hypothetical protein